MPQDNRKTISHVSITGLIAMTSDPKRIGRNRVNKSVFTTFRQVRLTDEAVQEPEESLKAGLESDTEDPLQADNRTGYCTVVEPVYL